MNKNFFNFRNLATVVAVSALSVVSTASFAKKHDAKRKADVKFESSVYFVSANDNTTSFLVSVSADATAKFQVNIKDKAGVVFFTQNVEGENFSKTFRIMNDELAGGDVTFSIKNLATGEVENFKVTTEEKAVSEVLVTKSK